MPKSTRRVLKFIFEERTSSAIDQARTAPNGAFGMTMLVGLGGDLKRTGKGAPRLGTARALVPGAR